MEEDAAGDAFFAVPVEPQRAPDYLDLVRSEVALHKGIFVVSFTVAGPIPDEPYVPQASGENGIIVWQWIIDTNPTTFPPGFPLQPNAVRASEILAQVLWDRSGPDAVLIDRRPLLAGGDAIVEGLRRSPESLPGHLESGAGLSLSEPSATAEPWPCYRTAGPKAPRKAGDRAHAVGRGVIAWLGVVVATATMLF